MNKDRKDSKERRKRRSFTEEFKAGAVALVLDQGKTIAEVARDIDVTASSLSHWVEQARADRSKGKTGLTTAERDEMARLRKENRELKMERDILKNRRGGRSDLWGEKLLVVQAGRPGGAAASFLAMMLIP